MKESQPPTWSGSAWLERGPCAVMLHRGRAFCPFAPSREPRRQPQHQGGKKPFQLRAGPAWGHGDTGRLTQVAGDAKEKPLGA